VSKNRGAPHSHFACDASLVTATRVDIYGGNLRVTADAEGEAWVDQWGATGAPELFPTVSLDDGVLRMHSQPMRAFRNQREMFHFEIHFPPAAALHVRMLAGTIFLEGGRGDVDLRVRFGTIKGWTDARQVRSKVFAGDILFEDLHGQAHVSVAMGDTRLALRTLRGDERIVATCRLGDVVLDLPPEEPWTTEGAGGRTKVFESARGTRIEAKLGVGDLKRKAIPRLKRRIS
jgi:hypothetical protein